MTNTDPGTVATQSSPAAAPATSVATPATPVAASTVPGAAPGRPDTGPNDSGSPALAPDAAKARRTRLVFFLLAASSLAWQFGFGLYRSIYNNFLVEIHHIQPDQLGAIESLRELPGLFTVVLVAILASLAPSVAAGLCALAMGVGLALYPFADGIGQLIAITVCFSVGFHILSPPQSMLVLHHAGPKQKGTWLGWMESVGSAAALLAMGAAAVFITRLGYSGLFFIAAASAVVGGVILFLTPGPRSMSLGGKMLNIRKEYITYYVMTLLQGARRHFFLVFAVYNLVEVHGVPAATIAILLGVAGAASVVTRPYLGSLAGKCGETKILLYCYGLTALVFTGYAFVHTLWILYGLFIFDSILNFELVITLYAYTVAREGEVAQTLAGGSTVGHITGFLVPYSGGLVWKIAGPAVTFLAGTTICLIGFFYAIWLGRRIARRKAAGEAAGAVAG